MSTGGSLRTTLLIEREVASAAPSAEPRPLDIRTLFEAHHASVWRLLRRLGVHPAQIDDATQEVFWVAARRLADIQPGRAQSFLYGVALRVAAHEARRRRATPPLADEDDLADVVDHAPSPEEQLEHRRARMLLDAVLDRMSVDLRTVLVLFELEGMEIRDIAELEEIPLGTASSRLRRAREEFAAISKRVAAALDRTKGAR